MAALQVPGTLVSVLTGLASMLLAIKLLEDDEAEREAAPETGPVAADQPHHEHPHHLPHLPALPHVTVAGDPSAGPGLTGLST